MKREPGHVVKGAKHVVAGQYAMRPASASATDASAAVNEGCSAGWTPRRTSVVEQPHTSAREDATTVATTALLVMASAFTVRSARDGFMVS